MKIFELVKSVLDDEFHALASSDAERRAALLREFEQLSDSYKDLEAPVGPAPDYQRPATRFAYIYKYTTCHANMVAEKIWNVPALRGLFAQGSWVNLAAIGGGPGSDFLGVIKHMLLTSSTGGLKCYMLDRESAWGDAWSDVEHRTSELPFRVSTHFQRLDVVDPTTWAVQSKHLSADLFTFVYFFSEIYRMKGRADAYFASLMSRAKPGSFFLFIDNDRSKFYEWFDELAGRHQLTCLAGGSQAYQLDTDEDKQGLEPYRGWLNHQPKLRASIAWRVYQKPVP